MEDWVRLAREWWDEADSETQRYMALVAASGFLSIVAILLEKIGPQREPIYRVRIEG